MAIRLNATGDRLRQLSGVPSQTSFTAMFWLNHIAITGLDWGTIVSIGNSSTGSNWGVQFNGTTGGTDLSLWSNGVDTAGSTTLLNTWYFIALSCSGTSPGELAFYLGGLSTPAALDAQATPVTGFVADAISFGGLPNGNEWVDGRYAAIKIFNTALSLQQVQAEQYSYLPKNTQSIVSWHPCFNGASERLLDYSGNSRSLTENGTLVDEDGPPLSWGGSPYLIQNNNTVPTQNPQILSTGQGLLLTNNQPIAT